MANEHGLFWDSYGGDRLYNAESMEEWLKPFFVTGVFNGHLQVTATSGMTVSVAPGYCNIGGKVKYYRYATTLTLEASSGTARTDNIVIERNDGDRTISLKVVKNGGAPIRESGIYQLVLAQITIAVDATSITQEDILDTRWDSELCGYVVSTVDEVDFDQMAAQFNEWFANFKSHLSGDVAGELQAEIDVLNDRINNVPTITNIDGVKKNIIVNDKLITSETDTLEDPNYYKRSFITIDKNIVEYDGEYYYSNYLNIYKYDENTHNWLVYISLNGLTSLTTIQDFVITPLYVYVRLQYVSGNYRIWFRYTKATGAFTNFSNTDYSSYSGMFAINNTLYKVYRYTSGSSGSYRYTYQIYSIGSSSSSAIINESSSQSSTATYHDNIEMGPTMQYSVIGNAFYAMRRIGNDASEHVLDKFTGTNTWSTVSSYIAGTHGNTFHNIDGKLYSRITANGTYNYYKYENENDTWNLVKEHVPFYLLSGSFITSYDDDHWIYNYPQLYDNELIFDQSDIPGYYTKYRGLLKKDFSKIIRPFSTIVYYSSQSNSSGLYSYGSFFYSSNNNTGYLSQQVNGYVYHCVNFQVNNTRCYIIYKINLNSKYQEVEYVYGAESGNLNTTLTFNFRPYNTCDINGVLHGTVSSYVNSTYTYYHYTIDSEDNVTLQVIPESFKDYLFKYDNKLCGISQEVFKGITCLNDDGSTSIITDPIPGLNSTLYCVNAIEYLGELHFFFSLNYSYYSRVIYHYKWDGSSWIELNSILLPLDEVIDTSMCMSFIINGTLYLCAPSDISSNNSNANHIDTYFMFVYDNEKDTFCRFYYDCYKANVIFSGNRGYRTSSYMFYHTYYLGDKIVIVYVLTASSKTQSLSQYVIEEEEPSSLMIPNTLYIY